MQISAMFDMRPDLDEIKKKLAGRAPAQLDERFQGSRAAVLIPLFIDGDGDVCAVFTKRREDLKVHAGEYSFPGGRAEGDDETSAQTALRETEEEIGHDRARIEVIGELDLNWTFTGYRVAPVVGILAPPFDWKPQAREVEKIAPVKLRDLLDGNKWKKLDFSAFMPDLKNRMEVYEVVVGEHRIWGLTARILRNFLIAAVGFDPFGETK